MLSPSFPRLSLKLSARKFPTSIISIGNHMTNIRLFSNKTNFQWKLLFGTKAKRAKPACRKQDTSVRQTVRKPRIRQPRFTSLSARLKRALYKKKTMPLPKAARSLSPRNRIAAFAQGPPPGEPLATAMKRTGTAGPFCRPPISRPTAATFASTATVRPCPGREHNDFGCCKNKEVLRGNPDESQQSPDSPKAAGRRKTLLNRISQRSP